MRTSIHEELYKGYLIKFSQDEDTENPRTEWDNLGTIGHWHRRYIMGEVDLRKDHDSRESIERFIQSIEKKGGVVLPISMLDHSGITIWVGDGPHWSDSAGWDSGQVGYIWIEAAKIRKEYSVKRITKKIREKVEEVLKSEVATFDAYLKGDVVGYVVTKDDEELDSCWGFFPNTDGTSFETRFGYALEEARSAVDYRVSKEAEDAT
jgi:hypothetical protein